MEKEVLITGNTKLRQKKPALIRLFGACSPKSSLLQVGYMASAMIREGWDARIHDFGLSFVSMRHVIELLWKIPE